MQSYHKEKKSRPGKFLKEENAQHRMITAGQITPAIFVKRNGIGKGSRLGIVPPEDVSQSLFAREKLGQAQGVK